MILCRARQQICVLLCLTLVVFALPAAAASGPSTTRVSVDSFGNQATAPGFRLMAPAMSADGRYVAFASASTNLVRDDGNGQIDVFVRDRRSGATTRASVSSSGREAANGVSVDPALSADGRYVAFSSLAPNLVDGDTNGGYDVFVRDLQTSSTVRASVNSAEEEARLPGGPVCGNPAISADGRYVAFDCDATNLTTERNTASGVFVRDLGEGTTVRISVTTSRSESSVASRLPSISADGRFVAFQSDAIDLVPNDGNKATDIFVRDLKEGTTVRASVNSSGGETNLGASSLRPSISADGGLVAFESDADNLVAGDANNWRDVFVRDLRRGQTARVSVRSDGAELANLGTRAVISGNGRFVAFDYYLVLYLKDLQTGALVEVNVDPDGKLAPGLRNPPLMLPAINATGRLVAFQSDAPNLVANDTNDIFDVFVRDSGINTLPVASFAATAGAGSDSLSLRVDATGASDADGWIESYSWTFGQGGTATGPKGVFEYAAPGAYTVALTVTDNDGATATASKSVTIQTPPQLPPPPASSGCTVKGTPGNDVLRGTPGADKICGLGGNDRINGRGGNDVTLGGAGNDVITGGPGQDTLLGGSGNDRLAARDRAADVVDGGPGRDVATIDRGRDRVRNVEVSK